MANFQTLRISSQQIGASGRAKIEIDGHELRGIRSIELTGSYDDIWRCNLEFLPGALDVEIEALIRRAPNIVISGSFVPPEPDGPEAESPVLDIGQPPAEG